MGSHHYKGFAISVQVMSGRAGGYVGTVTLRQDGNVPERTFDLPLDEELATEEEALREGFQYGLDLVDGVLPWFDPTCRE